MSALGPPHRQFAALPFTLGGDGDLRILLISTRRTGRWVLPKGWPDKTDVTNADTARREAFEEAGVEGDIIGAKEIGAYRYQIAAEGLGADCRVGVFALRVRRLAKDWPEKGQRVLRWCAPRQGADLVQEAGLSAMLARFKPPSEA